MARVRRSPRTPSAGHPPAAALLAVLCALAAGCADGGVVAEDPAPAAPAEPSIDPAWLAARFLTDSTALVGSDTLLLHGRTRPFYHARGFAAAWSDRPARDTLTAALSAVEDEGLRPGDVGADRVNALIERGVTDDAARTDRDLLLTDAYFRLADALLGRRIDVRSVYRRNWYPSLRSADTAGMLLRSLADTAAGAAVGRALAALRPADPEYRALRAALARARRDDGTPSIDPAVRLSPGDTSETVLTLRRRLAGTGDWAGRQRADTLARVFDDALAEALRRFQARRGVERTGELDAETVAALNTPGQQMVPLLAVNLERWRWLAGDLGDRHLFVNIPAYELELRRRSTSGWAIDRSMRVIVGAPGRWATPVFSDTVTQVVFNPTWTIPASIQLESYGRIDPRGMVRRPGPANPLGRAKFVFPNPYAIYLHDTNAPRRLQWEYRAQSHGCIRLSDPRGLAGDLLAPQGWDATRVAAKFTGPWVTEAVDLDTPVPIHLVYLTARVDDQGVVRRLADVYGRDRALAHALGFSEEALVLAHAAVPGGPRPGGG